MMTTEQPTREAVQFTGGNCREVLRFVGSPHWDNAEIHDTDQPVIDGTRVVAVGEWVVKPEAR